MKFEQVMKNRAVERVSLLDETLSMYLDPLEDASELIKEANDLDLSLLEYLKLTRKPLKKYSEIFSRKESVEESLKRYSSWIKSPSEGTRFC